MAEDNTRRRYKLTHTQIHLGFVDRLRVLIRGQVDVEGCSMLTSAELEEVCTNPASEQALSSRTSEVAARRVLPRSFWHPIKARRMRGRGMVEVGGESNG